MPEKSIIARFPMGGVRFHLHTCDIEKEHRLWAKRQWHVPHVWRCFRPDCKEPEKYICGLVADALLLNKKSGK